MNIILGSRRSGKTVRLIQEAINSNSCICCNNHREAKRIQNLAREMGAEIPLPMTYDELIQKRYYSAGIRGINIDNIEHFLQYLTNNKVNAITINLPNSKQLEYVHYEKDNPILSFKSEKFHKLGDYKTMSIKKTESDILQDIKSIETEKEQLEIQLELSLNGLSTYSMSQITLTEKISKLEGKLDYAKTLVDY